jgi:hypothetical protein
MSRLIKQRFTAKKTSFFKSSEKKGRETKIKEHVESNFVTTTFHSASTKERYKVEGYP